MILYKGGMGKASTTRAGAPLRLGTQVRHAHQEDHDILDGNGQLSHSQYIANRRHSSKRLKVALGY